jgi:hypothetical protein
MIFSHDERGRRSLFNGKRARMGYEIKPRPGIGLAESLYVGIIHTLYGSYISLE